MSYSDGRAGTFYQSKGGRWHEMHGHGTARPDGGINFNDRTPDGRHSHHWYSSSGDLQGGRAEGFGYPSSSNFSI